MIPHTTPSSIAPFQPDFVPVTPPHSLPATQATLNPQLIQSYHGGVPEVGQVINGYLLFDQIGKGAFGRVFLAHEQQLADREVVLKFTRGTSEESQVLAKLQHTNIMPIHRMFTLDGWTVIQMPFYGRQTLGDVVTALRNSEGLPISGEIFNTTLVHPISVATFPQSASQVHTTTGASETRTDMSAVTLTNQPAPQYSQFRKELARLTYVEAVLRMMRQLADGLCYAHEKGYLHLDIKPQNVLVHDEGQPLLLDFNLSLQSQLTDTSEVGGTLPYMSPELLRRHGRLGNDPIDARADLYAFGVMFFELLTHEYPFPEKGYLTKDYARRIQDRLAGAPDVRLHNPLVSPALAAIIAKLLAPKLEDRYQTAVQLHEDLTRQIERRPLLYAVDRNVIERVDKWRYRNPGLFLKSLVGIVATMLVVAGVMWRKSDQTIRAVAATTTAKQFERELNLNRVGLLSHASPSDRDRSYRMLSQWLDQYCVDTDLDWSNRDRVKLLDATTRTNLRSNLGETALLLAESQIIEARTLDATLQHQAYSRAIKWNSLATKAFETAPSVVWDQRAELARLTNDPRLVEPTPSSLGATKTTVDLFVSAARTLSTGRVGAAIPLLQETIDHDPYHIGAHLLLAICYTEQSSYQRAIERFLVAEAAAPTDWRGPYNRAKIHFQLGDYDRADEAYTIAIQRSPGQAEIRFDRSQIRRSQRRWHEAIADLSQVIEQQHNTLAALSTRAKCYDEVNDFEAAAKDRATIATTVPNSAADHVWRCLAIMQKDPSGALRELDEALKLAPDDYGVWQTKSHILGDILREPQLALEAQLRVVKARPMNAKARATVALLYARLEERQKAHAELAQVIEYSRDPSVLYLAACVYSVTSITHPNDAELAIKHFRRSLRDGFSDFRMIETDFDLDPIRERPEFQAALNAAIERVK